MFLKSLCNAWKKISFLEKELEVHLELQYKHFFINFIQAPLHPGRVLMVLIFPPVFHSKECMAPVLCYSSACHPLCSHMVGGILVAVLPCVSFPPQARSPAEQQLPELGAG